MFTTILAITMMVLALSAVLLAYEVLGNPKGPENKKRALWLHRLFGYLFALLFVLLFFGMVARFEHAQVFGIAAWVHTTLALAAAALLLIKILIAHRYKKFAGNLFFLGTLLFIVAFVTVALVGGKELNKDKAERPTSAVETAAAPAPPTGDWPENLPPIERTFVQKCGACHPLGVTMQSLDRYKTEQDWLPVIARMQ
nr:hypothetical protein [bacterium]